VSCSRGWAPAGADGNRPVGFFNMPTKIFGLGRELNDVLKGRPRGRPLRLTHPEYIADLIFRIDSERRRPLGPRRLHSSGASNPLRVLLLESWNPRGLQDRQLTTPPTSEDRGADFAIASRTRVEETELASKSTTNDNDGRVVTKVPPGFNRPFHWRHR